MKKWLILIFVFACLVLVASCAEVPIDETTGIAGEETTVISYTGMEGGFYVYEKEWQDYISGERDDYQVIAQSTPETKPMETTADPYQVLNELSAVPNVFIELADGSCHAPYASLVCAHVGNMVADGYLILQSTENVLLMWVKDGLIPEIALSDGMTMRCGDELLADTHTFTFYTKDGDSFVKVATLENTSVAELYHYGAEHFAGKHVYIRFDVKKQTEGGSAQYAYLFSTGFDETAPTVQDEVRFSEYLPQRIVLVSGERVYVPYIQLIEGLSAEDDEGRYYVNWNCLGMSSEQWLENLVCDGVRFCEIDRDEGVCLVLGGMTYASVFEIYDEEYHKIGSFTSEELKTDLDPQKTYYAAAMLSVDGRAFSDWQEFFRFAFWFKIK